MQLTSSTWWGFQYLQNNSRIGLRILSIALDGELKILHFCFMPKLVLSCLSWLFSFISPFSHFSDEIFSLELREGLEACRFFANKRQGTAGWDLSLRRPLRVLLSFTSGSGHTRWCLQVVGNETRGARLDQVLRPKDLAMLRSLNFIVRAYSLEKKRRRREGKRTHLPDCAF